MNERIKELRKSLGLNQTVFGEKIGIKQTTVAGYENGTRQPIDAVITSICREFKVSYEWLMYGTGKMFKDDDSDAQAIVDAIMTGDNEFAKKVIVSLAKMDEDKWEMIKEFIEAIAKE